MAITKTTTSLRTSVSEVWQSSVILPILKQMRRHTWRLYKVITKTFCQNRFKNTQLHVNKDCFVTLAMTSYFLLFMYYASPAQAASFKVSPSSGSTFNQNCQSSLDILLDTENSPSNAADIILNYDNNKIDIVEVKPGNVYPNYFGNVVDASNGLIRLTGANFTGTLNGKGVFATIIFKPKVSTGTSYLNIRFTGADQYNTLDSNIADAVTSNDLLTSVQNGFFGFGSGSCVNDITPPTIKFTSPTNGQQNVPSDANVLLSISDSGSGVDINSVVITINGVVQTFTYTGNSSTYYFTVNPTDPLHENSLNTVQVSASDLSGNQRQSSITFNRPPLPTTPPPIACPICPNVVATPTPQPTIYDPEPIKEPDSSSPTINFIDPISKSVISLLPTIKFQVQDDTSIDFDTIKVNLNNQIFTFDNPAFSHTGTPQNSIFTLKTSNSLLPNTEYILTIFAADSSGNGISKSINIVTKNTITNQIATTVKQLQTSSSHVLPIAFYLLFLLPLLYLLAKLLSLLVDDKRQPYGLVYNLITREPINKAKVIINNKTHYTNIFGIFAANLKPGTYQVSVSAPNFVSTETSFATKKDFDTYLNIPLEPIKTLPSSQHGHVVDKKGNPLTFLTVTLKETKFDTIVTTRITDKIGRYRFIVPHGRYQVIVDGHPEANFTVDTRHKTSGYLTINRDIVI